MIKFFFNKIQKFILCYYWLFFPRKINKLNLNDFVETIMQKHFSLWESLRTDKNDSKIKTRLLDSINKIMNDYSLSQNDLCAIGESMEWSGRQSKFVSTTQRSYEFHGHEWRLPLWDPLFMEFWEWGTLK